MWRINYLREVWIKIIIENINTYKEFVIKIFLGFGETELFMCSKFKKEHNFKLLKLKWLVLVKNVDRIEKTIEYKIEVDLYY